MAQMNTPPDSKCETTANDKYQHVDIDPDGDLLFIVGIEPRSLFRVSSKVISTASTVFRIMFGPNFKEGESLSQRAPGKSCEISLPEDDPAAMGILFKILHFQHKDITASGSLDVAGFREFAIACDKYNCADAVAFVAGGLLNDLLFKPRQDDELWILIEAVSFLDLPKPFHDLTKTLVLGSVENFLARNTEDGTYPFQTFELHIALQENRETLRHILSGGLMKPLVWLIGKEGFDTAPTRDDTVNHSKHHAFGVHDALQVSAYLRELKRLKLWPLDTRQISIVDVLKTLYRFEEKEIGPSMGFRMHGRVGDCHACTFDPRAKIEKLIKKVNDNAKGACLDCLRRGSPPSSEDMACRVKH